MEDSFAWKCHLFPNTVASSVPQLDLQHTTAPSQAVPLKSVVSPGFCLVTTSLWRDEEDEEDHATPASEDPDSTGGAYGTEGGRSQDIINDEGTCDGGGKEKRQFLVIFGGKSCLTGEVINQRAVYDIRNNLWREAISKPLPAKFKPCTSLVRQLSMANNRKNLLNAKVPISNQSMGMKCETVSQWPSPREKAAMCSTEKFVYLFGGEGALTFSYLTVKASSHNLLRQHWDSRVDVVTKQSKINPMSVRHFFADLQILDIKLDEWINVAVKLPSKYNTTGGFFDDKKIDLSNSDARENMQEELWPPPLAGHSMVYLAEKTEPTEVRKAPECEGGNKEEHSGPSTRRHAIDAGRDSLSLAESIIFRRVRGEGLLVVYGGECPHQTEIHAGGQEASLRKRPSMSSDVWTFNLSTFTWQKLGDIAGIAPPPTAYHSALSFSTESIFFFGGVTELGYTCATLHELKRSVEPGKKSTSWTWNRLQLLPRQGVNNPSSRMMSTMVHDPRNKERILVFGGAEGFPPSTQPCSTDAAYCFDTRSCKWVTSLALPNGPPQHIGGCLASSEHLTELYLCFGQGVAGTRENRMETSEIPLFRAVLKKQEANLGADEALKLQIETRDPISSNAVKLPAIIGAVPEKMNERLLVLKMQRDRSASELKRICTEPAQLSYKLTKNIMTRAHRNRKRMLEFSDKMARIIISKKIDGGDLSQDEMVSRSRAKTTFVTGKDAAEDDKLKKRKIRKSVSAAAIPGRRGRRGRRTRRTKLAPLLPFPGTGKAPFITCVPSGQIFTQISPLNLSVDLDSKNEFQSFFGIKNVTVSSKFKH